MFHHKTCTYALGNASKTCCSCTCRVCVNLMNQIQAVVTLVRCSVLETNVVGEASCWYDTVVQGILSYVLCCRPCHLQNHPIIIPYQSQSNCGPRNLGDHGDDETMDKMTLGDTFMPTSLTFATFCMMELWCIRSYAVVFAKREDKCSAEGQFQHLLLSQRA